MSAQVINFPRSRRASTVETLHASRTEYEALSALMSGKSREELARSAEPDPKPAA